MSSKKENMADKKIASNLEKHKKSSKESIKPKQVKAKESSEKKESKISQPELKTEKDIAMDFAMKAHQKFDRLIKASILFGSQAQNKATVGSDIDIIIVIDDASIQWDMELIAWYREELGKLVSSDRYNQDLHINTIKLTSWWRDILYGDPVVINILRYGEALIDSGGFFNPIKALLLQGKIHSTPEAVYSALERAPMHLSRSRASEMGAVEGIYWSMVDSAQATLMMAGKVPPSPEHIPEMLNETFVSSNLLKKWHVDAIKGIYELHKSIAHGRLTQVGGKDIDLWQGTAERFLIDMTRLVDHLIETKKD